MSRRRTVNIDVTTPGDKNRDVSMLPDETKKMEWSRRELEQNGHRRLARVNAREHHEKQAGEALDPGMQNDNIMQHPNLNTQRYDGVDPNLNPEPPLNSDARREYDNQRREQEMEKQLRLGNMPQFKSTPKPQGP